MENLVGITNNLNLTLPKQFPMVLLACTILCFECWIIGIFVVNRARIAAFGTVKDSKLALINET